MTKVICCILALLDNGQKISRPNMVDESTQVNYVNI